MKKKAGHVEDRAKERTTFSSGDIEKARLYVKRNRNKLKKGQTYSLSVPGKGYFVVGDVGTDKKNHVVKTVLGVGMRPPGSIIQQSLEKMELEKVAAYNAGYSWDEFQELEEMEKEAIIQAGKAALQGAAGKIFGGSSKLFGNTRAARTLSDASQRAYAGQARTLAQRAEAMNIGAAAQPRQVAKLQQAASQASERSAAQAIRSGQIAKAQGDKALSQSYGRTVAKQKSIGASQAEGARQTIAPTVAAHKQTAVAAQGKIDEANAALASATNQAQRNAALAQRNAAQKELAQANKLQARAEGVAPTPQAPTPQAPTPAPTQAAPPTQAPPAAPPSAPPAAPPSAPPAPPAPAAAPVEEAGMNLKNVGLGVLGGGALAGGGYLGYQALQNRGQQQQMPKYASSHLWHNIKNKSDSMSDALAMYKEASITKLALSSADKKLYKEYQKEQKELRQLIKNKKAEIKRAGNSPNARKLGNELNALMAKQDDIGGFLKAKNYSGGALERTQNALEAKRFGSSAQARKNIPKALKESVPLFIGEAKALTDEQLAKRTSDAYDKAQASGRAQMYGDQRRKFTGSGKFRLGADDPEIAQAYRASDRAEAFGKKKGYTPQQIEDLAESLKDRATLNRRGKLAPGMYHLDPGRHFAPDGTPRSRAAIRAVSLLPEEEQKAVKKSVLARGRVLSDLDAQDRGVRLRDRASRMRGAAQVAQSDQNTLVQEQMNREQRRKSLLKDPPEAKPKVEPKVEPAPKPKAAPTPSKTLAESVEEVKNLNNKIKSMPDPIDVVRNNPGPAPVPPSSTPRPPIMDAPPAPTPKPPPVGGGSAPSVGKAVPGLSTRNKLLLGGAAASALLGGGLLMNRRRNQEKQASIQYRGRTFPGYNQPIASDKKNKKKMVLAKKDGKVKLVHFGQKGYEHNYSKDAKKNYLTRSAGIRNKSGELTMNDKHSPNYWSRKVLWPKRQEADGTALKKK